MTSFSFVRLDDFAHLQEAAKQIVGDHQGYAFRGYCAPGPDEDVGSPFALVTGLEHTCRAIDGGLDRARPRELAIVREFMRRAHHYVTDVPALRNLIEWLALMQHHGAPTRLLDWTYSLHVAAHFALFKASRLPDAGLAIWMINTEWCHDTALAACTAAGQRPMGLERVRRSGLCLLIAWAAELIQNDLEP
jgi:FRG domain